LHPPPPHTHTYTHTHTKFSVLYQFAKKKSRGENLLGIPFLVVLFVGAGTASYPTDPLLVVLNLFGALIRYDVSDHRLNCPAEHPLCVSPV
jgi:hypothetical protein